MTANNYDLQIASLDPKSRGKSMQRYLLDEIPTVGAFGNEPYELRFYNKTANRVQVRLSIDGTDIITGAPATTDPSGRMWVVDGYGKLILRAWPETDKDGASFIFTSEDKTVAANTHGDTSHKGIIAAAVYTESYVPPPRLRTDTYYRSDRRPLHPAEGRRARSGGVLRSHTIVSNSGPVGAAGAAGAIYSASAAGDGSSTASMDFMSLDHERAAPGTGAGEKIAQAIRTVSGLVTPTLATSLRLRYLWWDDVVAKLKALGENYTTAMFEGYPPHPSGFPGDAPFKGIDLGSTPRPAAPPPEFHRFA